MRLFLALDLPAEVRARLSGLQSRLRSRCRGWRWVRPEGIHLTIRFLGEVEEERERRARSTWRRAARGVDRFRLRLAGPGTLPPRGRPRVLFVGVEPGAAPGALARAVEEGVRELGWEPARRPFLPHLTLARGARGACPEAPRLASVDSECEWAVDEMVLFRSELHPAGARYTRIRAFALGGAED